MTRKTLLVGKAFPRIEGAAKVTGQCHYLLDIPATADMLYAGLVTSTQPHARLLSIETEEALQQEGVEAVLTAHELPGTLGMSLQDRPILAGERVRYVGEPVAVVVAQSPAMARSAASRVRVRYKDLPVVASIADSLAADAPILHPDLAHYPGADVLDPPDSANVAARFEMKAGDMKTGWARADVILEQTYHSSVRHHAALEPHGAIARQNADGSIMLWCSTSAPYTLRSEIAQALNIPPDRLRVRGLCVGGGAGAKNHTCIEVLVVAAAMHQPEHFIMLSLDQKQEFTSTFVRPALVARLKMGVSREGEITALQASYEWDVGASADACLETVWAGAYTGTGPYRIPHVDIRSAGIYTNHTPASPMRGNDVAEIHWAIEQHIDQMAAAIKMDTVMFRLQNIVKGGDLLALGEAMHATGLDQCLQNVVEAVDWHEKPLSRTTSVRGKGLAIFWSPTTLAPKHSVEASARLDPGGCSIAIDAEDAGTGLHTFVAQLAATELGVPLSWVHIDAVDTASALYHPQPKATAELCSIGNAVLAAVRRLKQQLLAFVAEAWQESANHIDVIDGVVISHATERQQALDEVLSAGIDTDAGRRPAPMLVTRGQSTPSPLFPRHDDSLSAILHFCAGAVAAEVEVDRISGEIRVLQLAAALDVGHAINPDLVLSQIKGGTMQGLGSALWEALIYREGMPLNPSLHHYSIATFADLPAQLYTHIVEVPQDGGPYGARSLGADVPVMVAPAIANAIYNAVAVRINDLPITSERVWKHLIKLTNPLR